MTVFWIVAVLFLCGALLMLLPGLLRPRAAATSQRATNLAVHRDQLREAEADLAGGLISPERFEQARSEIQRRVLEDAGGAEHAPTAAAPARRTALVLALALPLVAVPIYLKLGQPEAIAPTMPAAATGGGHAIGPEQIRQMASALAERLKANPGDAEGWLMLGRSYTALGRFRDAATAFRRAIDLVPPNANLLADLADLTAMAQGKRLAGEPARIVQQALDVDPRHPKALALAGSIAFEARDYVAARGYWERLLALLPADSPMARSVRGSLLEVAQLEAGAGAGTSAAVAAAPARAAAATAGSPAADPATISGQVVLSPEMTARVKPGSTLFVFARAAEGPRMPLAILRRPATGQVFDFSLDDSMAMSAGMRLSAFVKVVVVARVSASGSATPQAGDLIGQSAPVSPGARGLRVIVDQVQN